MPRPKRSKVAPSAPAQLPESLMRAIRADAESKKREEQNKFGRRTSARNAPKPVPQEAFMSGALGVRPVSPEYTIATSANNKTRTIRNESPLGTGEQEVVPSSIQSEEARLPKLPSPYIAPSTVQRPIVQRSAMPSANWRTQATPRLDSSALGNFKRRHRQPSILGIGRQDDSSILSSLDGGDSDPFYDELEDFDPAVVTPLIRSKAARAVPTSSPQPLSNTRKRKRGSPDGLEVQVRRTPSIIAQETIRFLGSSPAPANEEPSDVELPPTRGNATTASRGSNTSPPEVWSDTMAPPQSSPSSTSAEPNDIAPSPKKQQRVQKKKAPAPTKKNGPQTRGQKSRALQPISTAQLQNLLPSRRTRQKSKLDDSLDSIEINSANEDEASFIPAKRGRAASKQPKTPVKKSAASKSKPKSTLRDKTNIKSTANIPGSALRKTSIKVGSAIKPRPTTARMYSRSNNRVASGQENTDVYALPSTQDDSGDFSNSSLADLDPQAKNELDAIARKFAEVDEWEMEFEEVDNSSGSGSGLLLGS